MNGMTRREFSAALAALAVWLPTRTRAMAALSQGPKLLEVSRGPSKVTILGFGDARDDSWFSPKVRAAFDGCNQLWLETVPPFLAAPQSPAVLRRIDNLRHTKGKTFLDWLTPDVRTRAAKRIADLQIAQNDIASLRPWAGYYLIMSAYYRRHPQAETKYVDEFLARRAVSQNMKIGFELPSSEAFVERMAQLSPAVQNEYVSWLLSYLDDQDKGIKEPKPYDWVTGQPAAMTRSLKRMIDMPRLYKAMQTRRNEWWANKVVELLKSGGRYFIGIGLLHVMGPSSIPNRLRALHENVYES